MDVICFDKNSNKAIHTVRSGPATSTETRVCERYILVKGLTYRTIQMDLHPIKNTTTTLITIIMTSLFSLK